MSKELKEDEFKKTGAGSSAPSKEKISALFKKSGTKSYFLDAFCLFIKLQPESEISESDFNRKLKDFLNLPLK